MARYEHLPIYKVAMDLGVYLEGMVHNFSQHHKYTTGQELRNLVREIIRTVDAGDDRIFRCVSWSGVSL